MQNRKDFEVRAEIFGTLATKREDGSPNAVGQPVDGRQIVGIRIGFGVANGQILVVGIGTNVLLSILHFLDAGRHDDFQRCGTWPPSLPITCFFVNVADKGDNLIDFPFEIKWKRYGDPSVDEDLVVVRGYLHANESAGVRCVPEDDVFRNGVGQTVGMTG